MDTLHRFWTQSFFLLKPTLTENNLPSQSNRVFIITGGYTGLGFELARIRYQRDGTVYIAGRDEQKALKAIATIKTVCPESSGRVESLQLDLSDLRTIKPAVEEFKAREGRLDVL
jgi:retinol dehydrogenase 12